MEWRVARAALLCLLLGLGSSAEVVEVRWGKDLQLPAGVVLRGLDETRSIPFSVPTGRVVNSARVIIGLRHSPALIDPSSLTVAVNGTPLSTVKLTPTNAAGVTVEAAIPPTLLKDYNQLQLLGAQHYTTACEDPFEASLWTAISSESRLVFDFGPYKHFPALNEFPGRWPIRWTIGRRPSGSWCRPARLPRRTG